jgi:hypothetical protein
MPLKLKPGKPLEFVLDCDADDPIETQVVFFASSLTAGQSIDLVDELSSTPLEYVALYSAWVSILARLLTGWENMPVDFEKANAEALIKDNLTAQETIELIRKIQHGQSLSPEEKKSSE